eukprot:gene11086-7714_t
MSKAAKNIMAKYGWKAGEGLGKDREGVNTYVKVVRRDPKTATGLGHVAEAGGTTDAATGELDQVYRSIKPDRDSDSDASTSTDPSPEKNRKRTRPSSDSSSDTSSSSSSGSGSDSDAPQRPLTDAELFKKCGGVRLGRSGRHRFFDGKLERVARSHHPHHKSHGDEEGSPPADTKDGALEVLDQYILDPHTMNENNGREAEEPQTVEPYPVAVDSIALFQMLPCRSPSPPLSFSLPRLSALPIVFFESKVVLDHLESRTEQQKQTNKQTSYLMRNWRRFSHRSVAHWSALPLSLILSYARNASASAAGPQKPPPSGAAAQSKHALQRLSVSLRDAEVRLEEQLKQLNALRSQLLLLEQRVGTCELSSERHEGQMTELARVTGSLQMDAANSEELVRQLEERLRHADLSTNSLRGGPREGSSQLSASTKKAIVAMIAEALEARVPQITPPPAPAEPVAAAGELAALRSRVDDLEGRLLVLEHSPEPSSSSSPAAAESVDKDKKSSAALLERLRLEGLLPFRTPDGTLRVCGKRVVVRNVPDFWGAAHVRELAEARVGGVVTCLLASTGQSPRGFEVVFRRTTDAIRAVSVLHGHRVSSQYQHQRRANGVGPVVALTADPVVAPEVEEMVAELRSKPTAGAAASGGGECGRIPVSKITPVPLCVIAPVSSLRFLFFFERIEKALPPQRFSPEFYLEDSPPQLSAALPLYFRDRRRTLLLVYIEPYFRWFLCYSTFFPLVKRYPQEIQSRFFFIFYHFLEIFYFIIIIFFTFTFIYLPIYIHLSFLYLPQQRRSSFL